jgi:hypothetical protein
LIDVVALLLDAVAHAILEMLIRASGPGHANYGYVKMIMSHHMIKRGEDLLVG